MQLSEVLTLFDYNYWANRHILSATARTSLEQFTTPVHLSHSSLRGTLVHCLSAEVLWRLRCQTGLSLSSMLSETDLATFEMLCLRWDEEEQTMRAYLGSLSDGDLQRTIHYTNTRGTAYNNPLWQILLHLVNHGTQCRSEAGLALTELGFSPGDIDLIYYLRQEQK